MKNTHRNPFWRQEVQKRDTSMVEANHAASLGIIALTASSNNYPPMAGVFQDLDSPWAQSLLNGRLHADMAGFSRERGKI